MKINKILKNYIEENIFPKYQKNDLGHNINHINYVIKRSLIFANQVDNINYNMVYTIAAYHDIGHHIDAKNHEIISGEILENDKNLLNFFTPKEIVIMKEAIEDHRASNEIKPRSIYGKIISSADRNTSIDEIIKRTYAYRLKHNPSDTLENIIEESRKHIIDKFGNNGYAIQKMYFIDKEYEQFLKDVLTLTNDKEIFKKRYIEVNKL